MRSFSGIQLLFNVGVLFCGEFYFRSAPIKDRFFHSFFLTEEN